jgi:hypothetical protein
MPPFKADAQRRAGHEWVAEAGGKVQCGKRARGIGTPSTI